MTIRQDKNGSRYRTKAVKNLAYEGASRGRRTKTLHSPKVGPNKAQVPESGTLRDRMLAAHRNLPMIYAGIERNVVNEVGSGVSMQAKTEDEGYNVEATALWTLQVSHMDPAGILNWHGQLVQAVRARRTQGETFIIRQDRRLDSGLPVPMQIQVLESCYCPVDLREDLKNGRRIREGIEFDKQGRRTAYYFHREHPHDGEVDLQLGDYLRVKAEQVIHHYCPTRPGQRRGTPDGVAGLIKALTFNSYDDAELTRKEKRAPFTGFLKRAAPMVDDETGLPREPLTGASVSDEPVNIEQGTLVHGEPGDELVLFNADDNGRGYYDFMKWQSLSLAQAYNIPYEVLTGDWKDVNDRLVRVIMQQFYRQISMIQDHLLVFQICRTCWQWFIESAVFSGRLSAPGYASQPQAYLKAEIGPQKWDYINPTQDIQAKKEAVQADLSSIEHEVSKSGHTARKFMRDNLNWIKHKSEAALEMGIDNAVIDHVAKIQQLQSNDLDMSTTNKTIQEE